MRTREISFFSENQFELVDEDSYKSWIEKVIASEEKDYDELNYIFCDDDYLLEINQQYLNHDTYTDIITFDNTVGKILQGDIFISTERVAENAEKYVVNFNDELKRVMIHGILHMMKYGDKTQEDTLLMRKKEEEKMKMFHVEQ